MRNAMLVLAALTALALMGPAPAAAQGNSGKPDRPAAEKEKGKKPDARGQGQGQSQKPDKARGAQGQGQGQGQARGRDDDRGRPDAAARRGPPDHARANRARRGGPAPNRAEFNRDLVDRAVKVRGHRNGGAPGVELRREAGELRVVREDGRLLFALNEDRAEEIGYWRVGRVPSVSQARPQDRDGRDRDRDGGVFGDGTIFGDHSEADRQGGAPAFCRSGEGHPVWGRTWCVDKGFGLGDGDAVWGWDRSVEDIVLRRPDYDRDLDRGGLVDILGDIVFGRIALQSLVLGADEPLTGTWLGERDGPRILRIRAGDLPVAELVDTDRDDEVDVMVFNLGS